MLVYRICKKNEIEKIFKEKSFENIGRYFEKNSSLNNHNYEDVYRYMHFFDDKVNILYLNLSNHYLCTYDIPEDILCKYVGIGYYWGFEFLDKLYEVREYAVKSEEINISFLKQVDYIKDFFEFDDYIYDENLTKFIEPIYSSNDGELALQKIKKKDLRKF